MNKKIYNIPEQNLDALKKSIEKLNKKCRRIGVPEITLTEHAPEDRIIGLKAARYIPVTVEGASPVYGGYKFIAVLDHIPDVGTVVRALPGEQIGVAYRDAKPNCDHCESNRNRKDTYLVRNEDTGDIKQVGSSCLKDFLGGNLSPEALVANAEALATINGLCEEFERAPTDFSNRYRVPLLHYLGFVAQEILDNGWTSRKTAHDNNVASTSDKALGTMYSDRSPVLSDEALQLASDTLNWAESLQEKNPDDLNDYEHNLMVVCKSAAIEPRSCGLAGSAVFCYKRNLDKLAEEARKKLQAEKGLGSKHVGTIKKREIFTLTLMNQRDIQNSFGGSTLYEFQDKDGNIVIWFSGSNEKFEKGKTYRIKGTVTKHEMFRNVNQTTINRCKVVE